MKGLYVDSLVLTEESKIVFYGRFMNDAGVLTGLRLKQAEIKLPKHIADQLNDLVDVVITLEQ